MKSKIFLTLIFTFFISILFCQVTQKGIVREFNSGKKPIAGVSIQFIQAVSTESDIEGKFILTFSSSKKNGDPISFMEAKKAGYELVNEIEMHSLRVSSDGILATDLILAPIGVIQAAKAEYAGASLKALTQNFEREKAELVKKVNAAQIKEVEYNEQIKKLTEEYDLQQTRLDALAMTFARVNFDDVRKEYKEALELFKVGNIQEAISILESQDISKQIKDLLQETKRIADVDAKQEEDKRRLQERKIELIDMLSTLADMHSINFNSLRAEDIMDTLLLIDSTDLTILQKAGDFYKEQHRYSKAMRIYSKIINHPQSIYWQVANAYGNLGQLFTNTGDIEFALQNFEASLKIYIQLVKSDSSYFIGYNLAVSCLNLGNTYVLSGNLTTALEYTEKGFRLIKVLHEIDPNNPEYINGLALSYANLGNTYILFGNLNKALEYYEKAFDHSKLLYDMYPHNVKFKYNLAVSCSDLANTYTLLGNLSNALEFYEQSNSLCKSLHSEQPNNIDFKDGLAVSYSKLGVTYTSLGNLNKALEFYEQCNLIEKELCATYPDNVEFKDGLAVSYQYLGDTHTSIGNLNMALEFFEQYNSLEKSLHEAFPDIVKYKNGLAISYQFLGNTHATLGNLNKALLFYEQYNSLEKELYEDNPDNVEFQNGLAISFSKLGQIHSSLSNPNVAFEFYKKCNNIEKTLCENYPYNTEFKFQLAISYINLGSLFLETDVEKAMGYLNQAWYQYKELIELSPENLQFKEAYDLLSDVLGKNPGDSKSSQIAASINQSTNNQNTFELYQLLLQEYKEESVSTETIAEAYNSAAWYGLLSGHFAEAEAYIREGINIEPNNKFFYTNLPPALLFQGKVKEAADMYFQYANQPFGEQNLATYREAFLEDFKAFAEVGVIPEELQVEVQQVIELLNRK